MIKPLPTWLIDENQFELFANPTNQDQCLCITVNGVCRVKNAPEHVKSVIVADMQLHPVKVEKLFNMGFQETDDLIEKYAACVSGAFDSISDKIDRFLNHSEYRACPVRETCPGADIVCNSLQVKNGTLSARKVQVLTLIGAGLLNKEIADQLNISTETVKIHIRQTLQLTDLDNKKDLIKLAYQKNLAS